MNELVVPSDPHWYRSSVVACAPDNTLVYGSGNCIVVIKETGPDEPSAITVTTAHTKYVTSVSLNKKWGNPHKQCVSTGEDNSLKVWDLDTLEVKYSYQRNLDHHDYIVGAAFAGEDRIVSVSANGIVLVWNIILNETNTIKGLFGPKSTVSCLATCPHASWLIAFGLQSGFVIVADLRRNGKVLYKLRGHEKGVISVAWCPAPINVFPKSPRNTVRNRNAYVQTAPPVKKQNPWAHLTGEGASAAEEQEIMNSKEFLKECEDLKAQILGEYYPDESRDETTIANGVSNMSLNASTSETIETEAEEKKDSPEKEKETDDSEIFSRQLPNVFDPSVDFFDTLDSQQIQNSLGIAEKVDAGKSSEDESEAVQDDVREDKDKGDEKSEQIEIDPMPVVEASPPPIECKIVEAVVEEPRDEYLLASSGKDRNVYIWRAGTDGRLQTFFTIPKKSKLPLRNNNTWITLCWLTPNIIISSSTVGEVLAWRIPKPKSGSLFRVVLETAQSSVFNIVTPITCLTKENWDEKRPLQFWFSGQKGELVNYDFDNNSVRSSISCITGIVSCMVSSPLDPNRLALGLRDGLIRMWDLSLPHRKTITFTSITKRHLGRFSAMAWHPTKDTLLAFGTDDGQVCILDTQSQKCTTLPNYFTSQVYKVEWGPIKGDKNNFGLYVLAGGKVAIYDIAKPKEEPVELPLSEKLYIYRLAWKSNYSLLLLSIKDGAVMILNADLTVQTRFYLSDKGFNSIVWHPDAFSDEATMSNRCRWFAAAVGKGFIVYDCELNADAENVMKNKIGTFSGCHLRPVTDLAWSPFDGNLIASAATDCLIQIWNVASKSVISTIVVGTVLPTMSFCMMWSPIEANLMIVSSKILTVEDLSKHPPKTDEEFFAERCKLLEAEVKTVSKDKEENAKVKKGPKNCIVPSIYTASDENVELQVANMRRLLEGGAAGASEAGAGEDCSDNTKPDIIQLFGSKQDVQNLLTANQSCHKKDAKHHFSDLISLWKGDLGPCVREAIEENRVTPAIITLAPMVSPKFWQQACESYATALSEKVDSDPLETAMYFLVANKIEEAVRCLYVAGLYREALALAKCRFPENDQLIVDVTLKWATNCVTNGNFEGAAYCYLSLQKYEETAQVLSRRNNVEFLKFAIELAEKSGNKELRNSIVLKYNEAQEEVVEKPLPSRSEVILGEMVAKQLEEPMN